MSEVSIRIGRQKITAQEGQDLLTVLQENKVKTSPLFTLVDDLGLADNQQGITTKLVQVGRGEVKKAAEVQVENRMRLNLESGPVRQQQLAAARQLLTLHFKQCDQCQAGPDCKVAQEAKAYLEADDNFHFMSNSVEIDYDLCIGCAKCVKTCLQKEVGYLTLEDKDGKKKVAPNHNPKIDCIFCGQCSLACPTLAIREQSQLAQVEQALADESKTVVVQMAPAVRVSIGEEFGVEPGVNMASQMYTALRQLGFDKIFDVLMGADITTLVEAEEIVNSIKHGGHPLPMFNSCCPSWVRFVEFYYPKLTENLAHARSPQIHAAGAYKTWWAEKEGLDPKDIVVVSIMPCTSKKHEARLEKLKIDGMNLVDYVLTTRETAQLLKKNEINLPELEPSEVDPLGANSGAAAIYGASGGVMESAFRTAAWMLEGKDLPKLEFEQVRGIKGIKKAEVELAGQKMKVAVVSSMRNARQILKEIKNNPEEYHCVEFMACPGGCIGGGGQPKPTNQDKIQKRMDGLYDIDQKAKIRKAHENQVALDFVQYAKSQDEDKKNQLLYTHYEPVKKT